MCSRPQFTVLTYMGYMGGTGPCGPMTIFFGSVNNKFGANWLYAQDASIPVWFIWEIPDPVDRYSPFLIRPMANRSLVAKFEVRSSLRSDGIVITMDGRTDRHSSNV